MQADALCSSRLGWKGRVSKLPEQRRKFRRDPLCERHTNNDYILRARNRSANPRLVFVLFEGLTICTGAYFDYHPPISNAVSELVDLHSVPTYVARTDRQRANQGPPEH